MIRSFHGAVRSAHGKRLAALLIGLATSLGCAVHSQSRETATANLAWPPGEARVELEDVVENSLGNRSIWRRLAGAEAEPMFTRPYSTAWLAEDLLVTDPGAAKVLQVSPTKGKVRRKTPEGLFVSPIGVAVCDGAIFVSDSETGKVARLSSDLSLERIVAEDLYRPTGLACENGRLWVVETGRHRVLEMTLQGQILNTIGLRGTGKGEFNYPTSISAHEGSLWIGDSLNFRIQAISSASGEVLATFGRIGDAPGEMPRVKGLAIDVLGRLWVSDALLDQVALYEPDGTFLMSLGTSGPGPGQFSFPAGVAASPDGRVAVVDSFNRRIQILRLIELRGNRE